MIRVKNMGRQPLVSCETISWSLEVSVSVTAAQAKVMDISPPAAAAVTRDLVTCATRGPAVARTAGREARLRLVSA